MGFQTEPLEEKILELEEQVKILQKSLTSSLQIQAGQGVEVKLTQMEDILQEEKDELFIKLKIATEALEGIESLECALTGIYREKAREALKKLNER